MGAPLLTETESAVMKRLVEAWNAFVGLPKEHADDQDEFRHGIHHLQAMILMRPARRDLNGRATP